MLTLMAFLVAAAQPAASTARDRLGTTAWVVASVGHSEFCPAGNVRLDLVTGRYSYTPRAPRRICNNAGLERPVRIGTLGAGRLQAARAAWRRALAEGLVARACRDGGRPDAIVVSNGGRRLLLLTTGAQTLYAPEMPGCWSEAATAFHEQLGLTFETTEGH